MNRHFSLHALLSALSLLSALCACIPWDIVRAQTAPAAPGEERDEDLSEIVVVANRAPQPLYKIGNSVTVLTETAIKESQLTVVSDLLAQTPGLEVARVGGFGQLTSVFIRGAESDQTVVVIDGVQINDPSAPGGGYDFNNLLTSGLARIEILRGSQSTLYGSQAIGGVVNIITTEPSGPFSGSATGEGGSHNTGYGTASAGGKDGALLWELTGNWLGTSGIPAFDERYGGTRLCASQIGGGSGRLRYDLTPNLDVDVRAYYTQSRTDFDGYDTPSGNFGDDNEYAKEHQLLGYGGLTWHSADRTLTHRAAYQYTDTQTRNYDPNAPVNYRSPTTLTFYGDGRNEREEYQGTWAFMPGYQAIFGAQHERSTIESYSQEFQPAPPPVDTFATIDSGYAQVQGEVVKGLTLTAGERYDHHDVFGGHTTGQLAVAWALNGNQTLLRASFGQGFKAPSLYQLYSEYGNPALRPEIAESWDSGVEQHLWGGRAMLSATYFELHSRDLIEFYYCTTLAGCLNPSGGYYANIARAVAHGVEFQGALNPTTKLSLTANYTLTETEDQSPGPTYGQELPLRPKNAANASLTYRWSPPLSTAVVVRYAGPSIDDTVNGVVTLGGYVVEDLRISYALRDRLELYARVENVADKHYETVYQYGTLGRSAYAGLRASF